MGFNHSKHRSVPVVQISTANTMTTSSTTTTTTTTTNSAPTVNDSNFLQPPFLLPVLEHSLLIQEGDVDLAEEDQLGHTTIEIAFVILSYLSFKDLISVQMTSKWLYQVGKDNFLWKNAIVRESIQGNWATAEEIENLLHSPGVKWKTVFRTHYIQRMCKYCGVVYRKCYNSNSACRYHPGTREFIEAGGGPTGTYWTCCHNRLKEAAGCQIQPHSDLNHD